MKAVVLVIEDAGDADNICKLIAATLSLNGYRHDNPAVIDWPAKAQVTDPISIPQKG